MHIVLAPYHPYCDLARLLGGRADNTRSNLSDLHLPSLPRLCRIYHPDRHHSPEHQQQAAVFFRRVQEAYRVLSDSRARAIYDRSGRRGLEQDMAIVERANLPSELLEQYEQLRALWEERTYIQEANPRVRAACHRHHPSPFSCSFTHSSLLLPPPPSISLQGTFYMDVDASSVLDHGRMVVGVRKMAVEQSVDAKLTRSTFAKVAGSVSATGRSMFGGLQVCR